MTYKNVTYQVKLYHILHVRRSLVSLSPRRYDIVSSRILTCSICDRFMPFVPNDDDNYTCHEVTVVFCISSFQYITLSVIFSKGTPFRRSIFTNCEYNLTPDSSSSLLNRSRVAALAPP